MAVENKSDLYKDLKVTGICGSLRRDSYNRKLLSTALQIIGETGAKAEEADLKEFNLPLYDADIETEGFPSPVERIRTVIGSADLILIASPEYNHSVTGALKNTIDWLSTKKNVLDGKTAAIFGASTGPFGTLRAQLHLRQILAALNVTLVPQPQVYVRYAKDAFGSDGTLNDQAVYNQLKNLIYKTAQFATIIKNIK